MGQTRIAADGTTDDEITDLVRQKLANVVEALHAQRAPQPPAAD
jgi:hypothetical protein